MASNNQLEYNKFEDLNRGHKNPNESGPFVRQSEEDFNKMTDFYKNKTYIEAVLNSLEKYVDDYVIYTTQNIHNHLHYKYADDYVINNTQNIHNYKNQYLHNYNLHNYNIMNYYIDLEKNK